MTKTGTGRSTSPGIKRLNVKGKDYGMMQERNNGKPRTRTIVYINGKELNIAK